MRYPSLACDYDGTLASGGRVDGTTLAALERLRATGRSLILVTGRQASHLPALFPRLDLFDRIVAENGAVLYRPVDGVERILASPAPPALVRLLERRGVEPLSVGRCIVATDLVRQTALLDAIGELGLDLRLSFNKGAVMALPAGVDKASGLDAALAELGLRAHECVGIGDAENDGAFLARCGCAVAVANAVEPLKAQADFVTYGSRGAGVTELIDRLLADAVPACPIGAARARGS